jgi:hypothetical protein
MKKLLSIIALLFIVAPVASPQSTATRRRPVTFANLGTPTDGNTRYCSDCAPTAPCTGGGSGAIAERVAGAWNCNTGAPGQAADSDLTAIAVLSPSNDDIIQRKSGAWTNRTIAQLKADLALASTNSPTFASLTLTAGLTTDTTTLVVDATNDRVGIGIASPVSKLQILGSGAAGGAGDATMRLSRNVTGHAALVSMDTSTVATAADPEYIMGKVANENGFSISTWDGSALTKRLELTTTGSTVAGAPAALATTATDGFLYIPTTAGTPTGIPTSVTGKVAMVYNTAGNQLCVYNAGWRCF